MTFTEDDLRATLTARSEDVPVPIDFAGTAVRQGRAIRQRRRVIAAGALAVCAGVVTVVGITADDADRPSDPDVVAPPAQSPALSAEARQNVVRVSGTAPGCARRLRGSGFVYAKEHVLTTAHRVAGTRGPVQVQTYGGRSYSGQVVSFDPRRDVAVLRVPGLPAPGLPFALGRLARSSASAAAFARGENLSERPARIRQARLTTGPDIYRAGRVTRLVYTVKGRVDPGMAGGLLLGRDGAVYGMIFAAALDDPDTFYVLAVAEIDPVARDGQAATKPVSTRKCAP